MIEKKEKRLFGHFFSKLINLLSHNEKKIYIFLAAFLIISLILYLLDFFNIKKILAFALFVLIGGAFKYLIAKFRIPVEFTPVIFFAVIIGNYMSLFWVIPYLIIADVTAAFLGGEGPTAGSVPYWPWMFLICVIALPFDITKTYAQILIPVIYFLGSLAIEQFVKGGLNGWRWSSAIANIVILLYFFLKFSNFFIGIIN